MQIEEEHGQRFALGLIKVGQGISAANEHGRGNGIQLIEERDRDGSQDQCDHKRALPAADPFEQVVQRQSHEGKSGLADELGGDTEAE